MADVNYDVTSTSEPILLPKQAKFGKKRMLGWREYRWTVNPQSDIAVSSQGNITYVVKLGNGTNSTMKLVYGPSSYHHSLITTTGTAAFDSCSNSVIDRVTEIGADVIFDCRKTNIWTNIVMDFTIDILQRKSFYSFFGCGGCGNNYEYNIVNAVPTSNIRNVGNTADIAVPAATAGALQTAWASSTALQLAFGNLITTVASADALKPTIANMANFIWAGVSQLTYNQMNANTAIGDTLLTTVGAYYAQIIPGSVIGAFQTRLFPISELSNGYELCFYLETAVNALVGAQTEFTMDKNRLHLCVIEYNEKLTSIIRSAFQNVFIIPTVSLAYFPTQYTMGADVAGSVWNFNVPVNILNAQGILFAFRSSQNDGALYYTLSQRCKFGISQYQLTIGDKVLPANRFVTMSNAVTASVPDAEGFMESSKFFNNCISNNACVGSVDYFNFNANISSTAANLTKTAAPGKFIAAFNLQGLFDSQDSEYRSCVNLESNSTSLQFTTNTAYVVGSAVMYVDCYVVYEQDLIVSQGVIQSKNKTSMNPEFVQPSQF